MNQITKMGKSLNFIAEYSFYAKSYIYHNYGINGYNWG